MSDARPVPGRECGDCNVCCELTFIDVPELQKMPGVLCPNCAAGKSGCQIYDRRPSVCRDFHCGWRLSAQFGDEWRPDRSTIYLTFQNDWDPGPYPPWALNFGFFGSLTKVTWPPVVRAICGYISAGLPVFISVPGPAGHKWGRVFLNDEMAPIIATGDEAKIADELLKRLQMAADQPKEKLEFSSPV